MVRWRPRTRSQSRRRLTASFVAYVPTLAIASLRDSRLSSSIARNCNTTSTSSARRMRGPSPSTAPPTLHTCHKSKIRPTCGGPPPNWHRPNKASSARPNCTSVNSSHSRRAMTRRRRCVSRLPPMMRRFRRRRTSAPISTHRARE